MNTRILLAIDGSECSENTLNWVSEALDKEQVRLLLLHVISTPPNIPTDVMEIEQESSQLLDMARNLLENANMEVECAEYRIGDPVAQICRYAHERDVDQIVVGSHGRTGLSRVLMGSVSMGVLEKADCPVFVHRNVARKPMEMMTPSKML